MSGGEILGALGFFVLLVWGFTESILRRVRRWRDLAVFLEMDFEGGFLHRPTIRGSRGGFDVRLEDFDQSVHLIIEGGTLPSGLEIGPATLVTRSLASDVRTGDETFDRALRVQGRPDLALAVLGSDAREAFLLERGAHLTRKGQLRKEWAGEQQVWTVEERLPGLLELARALRLERADVPSSLAATATSDPEAGVRLRNLRTLQEHHPDSPACRRACEASLSAGHPELRLWGAAFLSGGLAERIARAPGPDSELADRSVDVLADLATDRGVTASVNVLALRHLARERWRERAAPFFEEALGSGRPRVQRAAIEGLAAIRHRPAVARLVALIEGADPTTAKWIAEALEKTGGEEAEAGLIELLDHDDGEVRRAAIRSLGLVGSVAAVEPLVRVAGRVALGRQARAAEAAKARIQTRLEGAEQGQLSLAEPEALEGALSEVEAGPGEGAVSVVSSDEDRGTSGGPDGARKLFPRGSGEAERGAG